MTQPYRFRPYPLQTEPVRPPHVRHNPGVRRDRAPLDWVRWLVLGAAVLWSVAMVVKMLAR